MLSFKLATQGTAAPITDEDVQAQRRKELEEKVAMFSDVLDYDPDDALANYGKGQALLDLERFDEAEGFLKRALEKQKNHTMTYLALGKALNALQQFDEAKQILEAGIQVATRKGDLMPLKEMQTRLAGLN